MLIKSIDKMFTRIYYQQKRNSTELTVCCNVSAWRTVDALASAGLTNVFIYANLLMQVL